MFFLLVTYILSRVSPLVCLVLCLLIVDDDLLVRDCKANDFSKVQVACYI